MEAEPRRSTFTLKNLLAVMVVLTVLLGLAAPSIQARREDARRDLCRHRLKSIGGALQQHHDVFKRFPALTNQSDPNGSANVWDTAPGATFAPNRGAPNGYTQSPASAAGYSWLAIILPYLEEQKLFDDMKAASSSFTREAFSTTGAGSKPFAPSGSPGAHFATVQLDALRCPSFHGSGISTASSGTAQPPVTIAAYAALFNKPGQRASGVAITNYFALSATHLAYMANEPADSSGYHESLYGVIVPGNGLNLKSVLDGTSKTVIACETKEPAVNSWYDGTVCWTVGANPNASNALSRNNSGYLFVAPGTKDAGSLNFGPGANGQPLFAPGGTTPAQTQPVSWGPSSDHAGGIVMHLACDGSVHALTQDIDPSLYLQLISRAGREPITLPDVVCGADRPRPFVAYGEKDLHNAAAR